MIGIISGSKRWIKINSILENLGLIDEIIFKVIDDEILLKEEIKKNINLRVNKLIIDLDIVYDEESILQSIIDYRLRYDDVQIIVFTQRYKKGDEILSLLAGQGAVYDILCYEDENNLEVLLIEAFNNPSKYKNAIRFMTGSLGIPMEERKNINLNTNIKNISIKEKKERILLGSAIIAVGSAYKGLGCTNLTLGLAFFLANKGFKVAVLEGESEIPYDFSLSNVEIKKRNNNLITIGGVDIFPFKPEGDLFFNLKEAYNYVFLDLGALIHLNEGKLHKNIYFSEMNRATLPLIILPSSPWKLNRIEEVKKYINENWKVLINMGSEEDYEDIKILLPDKNLYKIHEFNALEIKQKDEELFYSLLKEILPEKQIENKGFLKNLFKKKE